MFLKQVLCMLKFTMDYLPLVVILGPTGTGKTKLSLELAKEFNGEIINSDSMQVYKGLDIITAKATKEELASVKHHIIDILEPYETFTVSQYQKQALTVINNLIKHKKLPIIVGGTNYYVESLLWKVLVEDGTNDVGILPENEHELPSEELHSKLQRIDPESAKRLHPNNKRKIIRALEVYYKQGKKLSDILKQQQSSAGGSASGGGLRFKNSIVLWLQCQQEVLNQRLNDRVDSMMKQGLLEELTAFHKQYNEKRSDLSEQNYTKGIFQTIGFKEFHSYLTMNEKNDKGENENELNKCIDQLKMVTRRYARKQNKWINNRFLGRIDREVPPIYSLDTTDIENWSENVSKIAKEIIISNICGTNCPYKPLQKHKKSNSIPNSQDDSYKCEICNRVFVGNHQWTLHLKSYKHKRMKSSQARKRQESDCDGMINKKRKVTI